MQAVIEAVLTPIARHAGGEQGESANAAISSRGRRAAAAEKIQR
jgi:hypothetical protein